jgi:hypothetical protein
MFGQIWKNMRWQRFGKGLRGYLRCFRPASGANIMCCAHFDPNQNNRLTRQPSAWPGQVVLDDGSSVLLLATTVLGALQDLQGMHIFPFFHIFSYFFYILLY